MLIGLINNHLRSLIALRLADAGNSKTKNPRSAQQSRDNSLSNVEANESRQNILNKSNQFCVWPC